jgi:hypothetical protein
MPVSPFARMLPRKLLKLIHRPPNPGAWVYSVQDKVRPAWRKGGGQGCTQGRKGGLRDCRGHFADRRDQPPPSPLRGQQRLIHFRSLQGSAWHCRTDETAHKLRFDQA